MDRGGNWLLVAALMPTLACGLFGLKKEEPPTNDVAFSLDDQPVDILEELAFAFVDETKRTLGPHSALIVIAGSPSTTPATVLGTKLQINLPPGLEPGEHRVLFTLAPNTHSPWVRLRAEDGSSWYAYDGVLTVERAGGVGEAVTLQFDELLLASECGEKRVLSAGSVDLRIGAETVYPETEVDMEIALPGTTELLDNGSVAEVDGRVWLCGGQAIEVSTVSGAVTASGEDTDVLEAQIVCSCVNRVTLTVEGVRYGLVGVPTGPVGEQDLAGIPWALVWAQDLQLDSDPTNDDAFTPMAPVHTSVNAEVGEVGDLIDVEIVSPIDLALTDLVTRTIDPSVQVRLDRLRVWGRVNEDCRPGRCP